jgi:hypothetical protein
MFFFYEKKKVYISLQFIIKVMEKIFVSIASYRDKQCHTTVQSIYKNAKYPERIFCGICEQNKEETESCIPKNFKYQANIRMIEKKYNEAKGPTYARYLCATLYENEDFFLQIDSHCLFVDEWDVKCINMIYLLENEMENKNVILSHYPPAVESYREKSPNKFVTHMVDCFFNGDGILTFHGAKWKEAERLPRRNAFLAGGFIFCRGQWVKDVPFDPHLDYLFTGEEILHSIRTYTSGWGVYTPNENIVFHVYTRKDHPKFWTDNVYNNSEVKEKVKIITGLDGDLKKMTTKRIIDSIKQYNLGKVRSMDDFYDFIGVDRKTKTIGKPKVEFFELHPVFNDHGYVIILVLTSILLFLFLIK